MKIDAQGAELRILRGARQTLSSNRNIQIVLEFVRWRDAEVLQLAAELGFNLYMLGEDGPEATSAARLMADIETAELLLRR